MMDNNSTTDTHVCRNSCCMDWAFFCTLYMIFISLSISISIIMYCELLAPVSWGNYRIIILLNTFFLFCILDVTLGTIECLRWISSLLMWDEPYRIRNTWRHFYFMKKKIYGGPSECQWTLLFYGVKWHKEIHGIPQTVAKLHKALVFLVSFFPHNGY